MSIESQRLIKDISIWVIRAAGGIIAYFAVLFISDIREEMKGMATDLHSIKEQHIRVEVRLEDTIKEVERHAKEINRLNKKRDED